MPRRDRRGGRHRLPRAGSAARGPDIMIRTRMSADHTLGVSARFLVDGSLPIHGRRAFAVHGTILQGTVRAGQRVRAPHGLTALVASVEYILFSATEGRESPALVFEYRDEAELARWLALPLAGQTLELEDGATDGTAREGAG